jgi:hypothetical protein
MVRPGREQLTGLVEVDETYVGGDEAGVKGRQTHQKAIVVIAVEILRPKGFGRVRMRRVADCSTASLTKFGYEHKITVLSSSYDPAHVLMPGVHRIASLLERLLLSTHQGAVGSQHLDYYLDEYTFRFNRRTSASRGLLFYRLMEQAVCTAPIPYRRLIGGTASNFAP